VGIGRAAGSGTAAARGAAARFANAAAAVTSSISSTCPAVTPLHLIVPIGTFSLRPRAAQKRARLTKPTHSSSIAALWRFAHPGRPAARVVARTPGCDAPRTAVTRYTAISTLAPGCAKVLSAKQKRSPAENAVVEPNTPSHRSRPGAGYPGRSINGIPPWRAVATSWSQSG
jgi:hypothetical protein